MSVTSLLERIEERNIRLVVEGGHLRYRAPKGALTSDIRKDLKDHKAELIAILRDGEVLGGPEVLRLAVMFREHFSKPGAIPFFVMPGARNRKGYCLTCGEEPPVGRFGVRCQTCITAAQIALSEQSLSAPR